MSTICAIALRAENTRAGRVGGPAEIKRYISTAGRPQHSGGPHARESERLGGLGCVRQRRQACRWHLGWALQFSPPLWFGVVQKQACWREGTRRLCGGDRQQQMTDDHHQTMQARSVLGTADCQALPYHMIAGDPSCIHSPKPIARWFPCLLSYNPHIIFDRRLFI